MANEDAVDIIGGLSADHPAGDLLPVLASPSTAGKGKNTIRLELVPVGCWKLEDVRFAFASSFLLPETKKEFDELAALLKKHPKAPLTVFGHADPVGDDVFNKQLSGNRAESVYAVLIRDVARWEQLRKAGGNAEGWGTSSIQHMVKALGHDPGLVDGVSGPKTKAAVKAFQTKAGGLTVDGDAGAKTREKLFAAYMDFLCPMKLAKTEFLGQGVDAGGKGDYQGCSEFNPTMVFSQVESQELNKSQNHPERDRENRVNRRVMILLFRPGTPPSAKWPCPRVNEGTAGCRTRFWSDGDKRRNPQALRRKFGDTLDTFGCRFYHRLTIKSPCEGVKPPPPQVTVTFIEFCLAEKSYLETRPWWPKREAKPFPNAPFDSKLTNGPRTGALGDKGCVRIEPIPGGACEVRFPKFYDEVDKLLGAATPFPLPVPVPTPKPKPPKTPRLVMRSVDAVFAPGAESLAVKYDCQDLEGETATLSVVSKKTPNVVLFERDLTAAELATGNGKLIAWDGKASDGKFIGPAGSPYTVRIQWANGRLRDSKDTKVEVEKIELAMVAPNNRIVLNDPDGKVLVTTKVFLTKKAGGGALTPVELEVTYTFTAGGSNTTAAASFVYAAPKTLGKTGDATALYWAAHPNSAATSPDGFKTSALAKTGTAAAQGLAAIFFLPSGVGGNTYKVKAVIGGLSQESPQTTVFRKVRLEPFEMAGQTDVSTQGTVALIQPFYTADSFVEYELGAVTPVAAAFTVKYIGLWDHATQAQVNWATHQVKTAAETPTAAETAAANGPAGPARVAGLAAVQAKANAWRDRIIGVYDAGIASWAPDAAVPVNSLVSIELEHPKYSADSGADATTAEWTAFPGLRINVEGRNIHPDARWIRGQGVSVGNRAYVTAGMSAARTQVVVTHEAGHETKNQFKKDVFGPGDHTAGAGLMDPTGSVNAFTPGEKKILRGIL